MDEAVALFKRWAQVKLPSFPGATLEVVRLPRRTPVIMIEVPDEGEATVLPYGISDKQPRWWGGRRATALGSRVWNPTSSMGAVGPTTDMRCSAG